MLPAGTHTLTAEGYGPDPSLGVVATGSGTVTVTANSTTTITLCIHDQTPNQPAGHRAHHPLGERDQGGTFETGLQASCGTVEKRYDSCSVGGYCSFTWTAPALGSVCKLTAYAINDGLRDDFSAGVRVQ